MPLASIQCVSAEVLLFMNLREEQVTLLVVAW